MKILLAGWLAVSLVAQTPAPGPGPTLTHGPLRGHVDTTSMHVWARASSPGDYTLQLAGVVDGKVAAATATATAEHDLVLHFVVGGLPAATAFRVQVAQGERVLHAGSTWTTARPDDAGEATVAFGSCAHDGTFPEQPIWGRILARAPQALVLLGDTPYIDLGTVEARRQRHRDFFAHPGVAAALQAIPTWTTWDDHDYAQNDQFGAVKGSETARGVFVDYHAHAGYGDGQRGIHTRFRQGPIEVFLLDTRSFADGEPSLLAPGERTLLGSSQTTWLQQGLRASTAPIKVLACGMVWNDGVRPGKKDHWGNWRPERDALFRWLGEQGIDGVVLVSGDVHRSRVILHPTRAVLGYDLPEFVTSPLAQNVLESNAVPTAGLVFDAGEAHSCLFLGAARGAAGTTLRAVFQAGDGREFHVREFAPGALARPDAAATYRRLAAELRARWGPDVTLPEADYGDDVLGTTSELATAAPWRQAVATAEPQLAAWHEVVGVRRCTFAPTSAEPLATEFVQELVLPLSRLQALNVAAALQAIADHQPERLVRACASALALARHLQQQPETLPWAVAAHCENQVLELLGRAAPLGDDVVGRLRALVAAHLEQRAGVAAVGVAARRDVLRLFEGSLALLRLGKDAQAQVARQFGDAVRQAFVAHVLPILDVVEAMPDGPDEAKQAELEQCCAALVARMRERKRELAALARDGKPGADAAADLGLLLATLLLPSLPQLCREQVDVLQRLRAAAR